MFNRKLNKQHDKKEGERNCESDGVTQIQCHGNKITERFPKCGGDNFHEPENQRDSGNLIQMPVVFHFLSVKSAFSLEVSRKKQH